MNPNTHSRQQPGGLDRLAAVVDELATEDLDCLTDAEAAQRVLVLRGLIERLEGVWLRELAGVDGRGAAGADQGIPAESTAGWLRNRTRMGHPDAHQRVRVARALHRGPLGGTAKALADGELSYPHAAALTRSTHHLPSQTVAAAEPVLLEAARRQLEGGRLPTTGGVRPQVAVTIELASLLGQPGLPAAEGGWVGPLPAETARRLACDATLTRVLVTRHPHGHHAAADGGDDPTDDLPA